MDLRGISLRDLDQDDPLGGVSGFRDLRRPHQCAIPYCRTHPFFVSFAISTPSLPPRFAKAVALGARGRCTWRISRASRGVARRRCGKSIRGA